MAQASRLVIYIAGPFRGSSSWDVWRHIMDAMTVALEVWRLGAVAICPHGNTFCFDKALDDAVWMAGSLELLQRCDGVLLLPTWGESTGSSEERATALELGIPVLHSLTELKVWLQAHDRHLIKRDRRRYYIYSEDVERDLSENYEPW